MEQLYNALLIDPEMGTRNTLKQGLGSIGCFERVFPAKNIKEGKSALERGPARFDVVFISERLGAEAIRTFITEAQESARGKGTAYIIVLRSQSTDQGKLASNLLTGVDGFLCEPFSVDNIRVASENAVRVRRERKKEILHGVFGMLVGELISEIDRVAFLAKNNRKTDAAKRRLQTLLGALNGMDGDSIQIFFDVMCERFPEAKVGHIMSYDGASTRVKQLVVERLEREVNDGPEDLAAKLPWLNELKNA